MSPVLPAVCVRPLTRGDVGAMSAGRCPWELDVALESCRSRGDLGNRFPGVRRRSAPGVVRRRPERPVGFMGAKGSGVRWFWIDRFEKFVSGEEAVAVKNVTLSDEPLDGYFPGLPHYPHSLIIEGMAQTGGILLSEPGEFKQKVVLAKVGRAEFFRPAIPGDRLRLTAKLVNLQPDGAIVDGSVDIDGEVQAEMNLTFAILDDSFGREPFFIPGDFCRILRSMRLFDVGVRPDGSPISVPPHMLEAERETLARTE